MGIDEKSVVQQQQLLLSLVAATALAGIAWYHREIILASKRNQGLPKDVVLPPHAASWIPFVGSAIEMGTGIVPFIRKKSRQLGNHALFTATIMGQRFVFFAHAEDVNLVFKSKYNKYLDSSSLQKDFVRRVVAFTNDEVEETFQDDIIKTGKTQYNHYLFQKEELSRSTAKVQEHFWKHSVPSILDPDQQEWTQRELFDMVFCAIFKAQAAPIMSDCLEGDEVLEAFRSFDKGVIPMFNNAPNMFTRSARQARSYLLEKIQSPQFQDGASPLMQERKNSLDVRPETLHKANVAVLWATVGNSVPAIFWTLLRLMEDREAWNACRSQVDQLYAKRKAAAQDESQVRLTLSDLDELTLLESAFWEVLRLYNMNFTARTVTEDFVLETKTQRYFIQKGSQLMPFWGILHYDPDVFDNPQQFQYDRFIGDKEYTFNSGAKVNGFPVVAFGGGEHLCPGRKFISYEVRLFSAMLMHHYDMQLAPGESIPGIDLANQGIGVSHPDRKVKTLIRERI